jgi:MjaII restriction endonuclease.
LIIKNQKARNKHCYKNILYLKNFLIEKEEIKPNIFIYLGTAYNMFGEGNYWKQDRVRQFFADDELLIGKDYWNFVCNDDEGFDIIMKQYSESVNHIKSALENIKNIYFRKK